MQPPQPSQSLVQQGFSSRVVLPAYAEKGKPLILAEAPGATEDKTGLVLHPEAEAGGLFTRLLARVGLQRERFVLTNTCWQRPPHNELYDDEGYPKAYTHEAINYWKLYLLDFIQEMRPPVIIGLGRTALEVLTGFTDITTTRGYVHWSRLDSAKACDEWDLGDDSFNKVNLNIPCTCTYHPQFLNYGNRHLSGVFIRDVLAGVELGEKGWCPPKLTVTPTPTPEQFGWFCRQYNPDRHVLTYDIENPETRGLDEEAIESELGKKEISYVIDRMSFCFDSDIGGFSVPFAEPFIAYAKALLASGGVKRGHNCRLHDRPRLVANGFTVNGREEDTIELWRHLHRTLPASVAYIAPFYLNMQPWKHEAHTQPEWYSAMDAVVQHHIGEGIERDLRSTNQWDVAQKHVVDVLALTEQMSRNGLPYDANKAREFQVELEGKLKERLTRLQVLVPDDLKPVKQKEGLKKLPKLVAPLVDKLSAPYSTTQLDYILKQTGYVYRQFTIWKKNEAGATLPEKVNRWALLLPFNPESVPQKLNLIHYFGHKAKTDRKTKGESTGDATMKALVMKYVGAKNEQEMIAVECYQLIRECTSLGTIIGFLKGWKPSSDGLLHATPGMWGDMFRLTWRNPPLAATPSDKKTDITLAAGFRRSICVPDDQIIIESDWRSQEAVILGWYAKDQDYIRIANLSLNAYMCSHLLERPADLSWSDNDLRDYLRDIREDDRNVKVYDDAKHTIYLIQNGGTPFLIHQTYELPLARATYLFNFYFELFPKIKQFHQQTLQTAYDTCRLVNKWNYRMPTWDTYAWVQSRYDRLRKLWVKFKTQPINDQFWTKDEKKWLERIQGAVSLKFNGSAEGEDKAIRSLCYDLGSSAKPALSFFPRDTGSAMLKDALLALDDEYGLVRDGHLRASAHDSIVAVTKRHEAERVAGYLREVQERPVPQLDNLVIYCDQKFGQNWDKKAMRPMRMFRREAMAHV